ncbi:MAG TPA: sigma factor-like helix-turn-helix DNA-binding protein, partial [Silvibacterium sp.]|nr:sigma factor-like helix-turn-helix DNA-binding protein [Silvibacterium sp.]
MLGSFDDAEDAVQEAWLRLSRNESSGIANLGGWLTTPAERLAFVLHDLFALPFDEIALIIGRSSEAARQLASRARRRVQGAERPETNLGRQRELVDAFVAAAHGGDFDALIRVLDPEVVLRADRDPASRGIRGSVAVAEQAVGFARL